VVVEICVLKVGKVVEDRGSKEGCDVTFLYVGPLFGARNAIGECDLK
jgi:hypothetical protein